MTTEVFATRTTCDMTAVCAYIRAHLDEPLSLEQLSRQFLVSKYHFAHQFRAVVGVSPHQYVIQARMDEARRLLRCTGLAVRRIASQTGYHSESMFCKAFRRTQGVTPGEYRARFQTPIQS